MKRKPSQKPLWMMSLMIGLLALLPLLAVLQYRWLGQVSEGERERMKNNLVASARQFCQDFDGELTALYLFFQQIPTPFSQQADQTFAQASTQDNFAVRYRRWRESSAHPNLVKEIYQTELGENDGKLARFNPETGVFETCEWPDNLLKLRKSLEERRAARESARLILSESFERKVKINLGDGAGDNKIVYQFGLGSVDEDLPGLIIPIGDPLNKESFPIPDAKSYRIVALNAETIKQVLIPELVKRHFGGAEAGEYRIAVATRNRPDEAIYLSDVGAGAGPLNMGPSGADVTAGFFGLRVNEANRVFLAHLPSIGGGAPTKNVIETQRRKIEINLASKVTTEKSETIGAPVRLGLPSPQLPGEGLLSRNGDGGWRLIIKHRAGSLEAAVTKARHRNLAISFGILLLLGVSVGFIALSSRRAQRLATQQMEFVAGVSHELRTPLAVICSAAENLADGVIDNREQVQRYGSLIRDEGRRLTSMVEQALEFAGAQSGRKNYELRPTDLNQVIEDAIAGARLQLAGGGFELEKRISASLPMVNADAAALSRAIQNLLNNAMKYSGDSRWIGLSAESVKTADGDQLEITVSDRGLGIAPSEHERIFEPFYRGKEVMAAQIHGNGLGLSLVKHIVAAHGGRVNVESKVGQGSRFIMRLPVAPLAQSQATNNVESGYERYSQLKTGPSQSAE
jgi:signal transduction histidine kinase